MHRPDDRRAAALLDIADRLSRLPAHDRRNPHAFTEGKSELTAELKAIAQAMTGRIAPAPGTFQRPRRQIIRTIEVGDRRVMVQVKRAAFAI